MKEIPIELEQYIKSFMYHQEYIVFGFHDILFKIEETHSGIFKVMAGKVLIAQICVDYEDIKDVIERVINKI